MFHRSVTAAVMTLVIPAALGAAAQERSDPLQEARRGVVAICAHADGQPLGTPSADLSRPRSGVIGSGIVLARDGLILTANHIVEGRDGLSVVLWDSSEYSARVVAADRNLDIAVLRVHNGDLSPLDWRLELPARVGETVYTLGTPAIFGDDPAPSLSRGIVSALNRALGREDDDYPAPLLLDLIETDAQLLPGESGGALLDEQGRLLGLCVAAYYTGAPAKGRAFALPADPWLREGVDALLAGGRVPVGRLGLQALALTPERARRLGLAAMSGVQVSWVEKGGPCDRAGIVPGDIVTKIDGRPVRLVTALRQMEMRLRPGTTAEVTVYRASPSRTFAVVVEVQETAAQARPAEIRWRGMRLADLTADARRAWSIHTLYGALVVDVDATSNAYRAGIRKGNVIVEINDRTVRSLVDFREATKDVAAYHVVRVRTTDGIGHIRGESGGE